MNKMINTDNVLFTLATSFIACVMGFSLIEHNKRIENNNSNIICSLHDKVTHLGYVNYDYKLYMASQNDFIIKLKKKLYDAGNHIKLHKKTINDLYFELDTLKYKQICEKYLYKHVGHDISSIVMEYC
jgi:hypothetical protein